MVETIAWKDNQVVMIDQRKLPLVKRYVICKEYRCVIKAIRELVIRGAPAIGVAAAMGVALGALKIRVKKTDRFLAKLDKVCCDMVQARPTAVNLAWAVDRMKNLAMDHKDKGVDELKAMLVAEAKRILEQDVAINKAMGKNGQALLTEEATVLTHCNAGALATGGYGTALGVVRAAVEAGKRIRVFADETRPFLQGARLTAWELTEEEIPVTLITDNAAGAFMSAGRIDAVIVGADRIAANGDVANKIGTYMVAVLAKTHRIPFYVAAPLSTIDFAAKSGADIPIEDRSGREVTHLQGKRQAPPGASAENPAFDITPSRYVSAIITERGVVRPPFRSGLKALKDKPVFVGESR
jgi:methylthioribose-1-phosphate isomerase